MQPLPADFAYKISFDWSQSAHSQGEPNHSYPAPQGGETSLKWLLFQLHHQPWIKGSDPVALHWSNSDNKWEHKPKKYHQFCSQQDFYHVLPLYSCAASKLCPIEQDGGGQTAMVECVACVVWIPGKEYVQ